MLTIWQHSRQSMWLLGMGVGDALFWLLRSRSRVRKLVCLLSMMDMNNRIVNLPFQRTGSQGPLKTPDCFSHVEFVQQFRFRKVHFHRILRCLKDDNGQQMMVGDEPILLKFGKARAQDIRACRLSFHDFPASAVISCAVVRSGIYSGWIHHSSFRNFQSHGQNLAQEVRYLVGKHAALEASI